MSTLTLLPAPVLVAEKSLETKWDKEREAFFRRLPELLSTCEGQYVAVHGGEVIESGPEIVAVAMRAYDRHGYIPIYIDLVTDRPIRPVRLPSPRLADFENRQ